MKRYGKGLFSFVLVFSLLLAGLPNDALNGVFAETEKSVQLGVNGSEETSGYDTIEQAVKAIETLVKENAANRNNSYEIYLTSDSASMASEFKMPEGDYTFPEVKRVSFIGGIKQLDGSNYTREFLTFTGNLTFSSEVEFLNVQLARGVHKEVSINAGKVCIGGDTIIGSHMDMHTDTAIRINCEKFYSCSAKEAEIIDAGNCGSVDELLAAFEAVGKNHKKVELINTELNTDDCYAVGRIHIREDIAVSSHIKTWHTISTQGNEWQPTASGLDIISSAYADGMNETAVTVDNLIMEYMKCHEMIAFYPYGDVAGKIVVGNISINEANSSVESVDLEVNATFSGGHMADGGDLYITGQMSGISEINNRFNVVSGSGAFSDWRDYFTNEDGSHRFTCLHIEEEQVNAPRMRVSFYADDVSGDLKISRNESEYYIDFDTPIKDIFDYGDGVQCGDFIYELGENTATPWLYVGESTTMELPEQIEYDNKAYNVNLFYAISSLETNVERLHLPSSYNGNEFTMNSFGFLGKVNDYLPGGKDASAFKKYIVDGDSLLFVTDEEGNLYSKNGAVLYSVPPAKTGYTFPETVSKIAEDAFANSRIKELVIPGTVQIIEQSFTNMKELEKIVFSGSKPIDFRYDIDSFRNSIFTNCGNPGTIVYGAKSTGAGNEALRAGFLYEEDASVYGTDKDVTFEALENLTIGNVDGEEGISAEDALEILKVVVGLEHGGAKMKKAADVNFSGEVEAEDALCVLKKVVGLIDDFEEAVEGEDAYCKLHGHAYSNVKDAAYEEEGEKKCESCDAAMTIPKKDSAYVCSYVVTEPGENTPGRKILYDLDTGAIENITIEPLLGTIAPSKVWILGDSIAAYHDKEGYERPLYGWGEVIGSYYTGDVKFINKAKSSQSSKSYVNTQEYSAALGDGQSGIGQLDYVIISFGHNDHNSTGGTSRLTDPEAASDVEGSFKWYLKNYYIDPVLARGAVPFLMSPVCRCFYNSSGVFEEEEIHLKYAKAMKELVEEYENQGIRLYYIDAQEYTYKLYSGLTKAKAMKYHGLGQPSWGQWYEDTTHYSEAGAAMISEYIVQSLRKLPLGLNEYLKNE